MTKRKTLWKGPNVKNIKSFLSVAEALTRKFSLVMNDQVNKDFRKQRKNLTRNG